MNKIVREHYPASKLPEDLREGIPEGAEVIVTVEIREKVPFGSHPQRPPMTAEELRESIKRYKAQNKKPVTADVAVARVRELRDEWDHR